MPTEVLREPLALKLSLPGEETCVVEIGDLPNPRLAADLAEGLAASVHPHGPLGKRTTFNSFLYTLRRMVRELAEDGFDGSAAELTRTVLSAFWLRSNYLVEYRTRSLLRALDQQRRVLDEPVRQMVFGINYKRPVLNGPLQRGRARLAAAIAKSIEPPLLQLHRTVPHDDLAARIDDAVGFYEYELARFAELRTVHGPTVPDGAATAGPQLARLLHDLNTAEQPTWAWPLAGGEGQWRRIARKVTAGQDWPRT
ncbi:hypothetical protein AB0D12_40195 [Streptomyces sp. NPDC048479]|uniref:hypothetical protein n=1 Tax=Streptomyces sp. NPDC048479 TaxID=3154725 RepID=UPI003426ED1E